MELSAQEILLLGLIASGVSQVLKLLSSKANVKLSRVAVNLVLFVISALFAFIVRQPELPPIDDPMAFAIALSEAAVAVFGFASLAYNLLLKNVVYPAIRLG